MLRLGLFTSEPSGYTVWATILWGIAAMVWAVATFVPGFLRVPGFIAVAVVGAGSAVVALLGAQAAADASSSGW